MIKKLLIGCSLVLLSAGVASADWLTLTNFKTSSNVAAVYDAATADAQTFALRIKHKSGDRVYATTNVTSKIWYQADTAWKGVVIGSVTVTGGNPAAGWDDTSFATNWTSQ